MKRERLSIERELKSKSAKIIWPLLSTPEGLAKWLADDVKAEKGVLTFTWGNPWGHHDERKAEVVGCKDFDYIRYRWLSEDFEDCYWELKIEKSDITEDYILIITDFALADDTELIEDLWDANLETLHRNTGL